MHTKGDWGSSHLGLQCLIFFLTLHIKYYDVFSFVDLTFEYGCVPGRNDVKLPFLYDVAFPM
jgi:hypothetical protein